MGERLTLARRELGVLASEKTIVLALAIQIFIAAFSSFLVVGLVSLYDPGSVGGYEVEVAVTGDAQDDLLAVAEGRPGVEPRAYDSPTSATRAFSAGRVDAVLVAQRVDGRVAVTATVPDSNVRTTVVVVQLRNALQAYERTLRERRAGSLASDPLPLPSPAETSPYYGFTYTVLVPLLLFLPVFISGSIAVDSLTEEVERGTLELLRVAPVSLPQIVDGKLLAAAGLAPVQAALWLALLEVNGTTVANEGVLVVAVAALAVVVTGVGAGVALLAPDRRAAQFLYSLGVLAVFGGTTLLPGDPSNTAALLAVGSATTGTYLAVAVYAVGAVGAYLALRGLIARTDPETL